MPNPRIPPQDFDLPVERKPSEHNGWLSFVPGDIIGGRPELPPAREGAQKVQNVIVEVPGLGRVCITYELASYRHGKSRNWHWRAVWADRV